MLRDSLQNNRSWLWWYKKIILDFSEFDNAGNFANCRFSKQELNKFYDWYWVFHGSVAERSKALVLGTSLIEAWVRIPPLPQVFHSDFIGKKGWGYGIVAIYQHWLMNDLVRYGEVMILVLLERMEM